MWRKQNRTQSQQQMFREFHSLLISGYTIINDYIKIQVCWPNSHPTSSHDKSCVTHFGGKFPHLNYHITDDAHCSKHAQYLHMHFDSHNGRPWADSSRVWGQCKRSVRQVAMAIHWFIYAKISPCIGRSHLRRGPISRPQSESVRSTTEPVKMYV